MLEGHVQQGCQRVGKCTDFFHSQMFDLHNVDIVESNEISASSLGLATQKHTKLVEQLAEIAYPFLNDALPSTERLAAAIRRATVSQILAGF